MPVNDIPAVYDKKIQFYNFLYRITLLFLVLVITIGVIIGVRQVFVVGHKVDVNVQNTKAIIEANQASTVEARKQNADRQENLKNYVRCIVLIGKTHPEINFQTASLDQTKAILDECATTQ